jgi:oligopeptide/dipeptide ABC transporter ATP-binding protein
LFRQPVHPYTIGLIEAVPKLDSGARWLTMIPGRIPDPQEAIRGCRFGAALRLCAGQLSNGTALMLTVSDRQSGALRAARRRIGEQYV